MNLTQDELNTLRKRPTSTTLNLFIFQPRVALKCRIDAPDITKGAINIPFDSITEGNIGNVDPGMTLLIGTSEGKSDVGRIRVRTISSGEMTVSENSNIHWEDELHLTVLRYYETWPVFPRIIKNPSNPESVIFYKDYDIAYTNQNSILGTFINMGPHRPVFIENGVGRVFYSSSGTHNLLGETLEYDWVFEGGTPSSHSSAEPGWVEYDTPGDYITELRVSTAAGAVDTSYRYISVKNRPGEGQVTPVAKWTMDGLNGSRGEGGYNLNMKVYDDMNIEDNAVVMLIADDWYGDSKVSLGGYKNSENVFFVGYVEEGSVAYNYKYGYQSFTVASITSIMKKLTSFSVSVTSKPAPATWYELYDMDVRRAIYHYLRWHSTVLSMTDFKFVGNDYKVQYFDVDRTSIYDAVNGIMSEGLLGSLSSDRQGRLWAEVSPQAYIDPTGTFASVMEITKHDWKSEPNIETRYNDATSYMEFGGIAYSGAFTGTYGAFLSGAPGVTPSFAGSVEAPQGLIILGQDHLNYMSGNVWANKNQKYPTITMDMSTPVRNLDIAPQEVVYLKIQEADTTKRVTIDGVYIPSSFTWSYDSEKATLIPKLVLSGLVNGRPGDTILIPATSDDIDVDWESNFDFNLPPLPPIYPYVIIDPLATDHVAMHVKNRGIVFTDNFTSPYPTWQFSNYGLPVIDDLYQFEMSNSGKLYLQVGQYAVYVAEFPGASWSLLFSNTQITNVEEYPFPRDPAILGFGVNRNADDEIVIIGGLIVTIFSSEILYAWYGSQNGVVSTSPTYIAVHDFSDVGHGYITKGENEGGWTVTYRAAGTYSSAKLASNGSTLTNVVPTGAGDFYHTQSKKSPSTLISSPLPYISYDSADSWSKVSGTTSVLPDNKMESYITNEDGTQIVIGNGTDNGVSYSNDSGVTWQYAGFSGTATSIWHLGDDNYIVAGNNTVFLLSQLYSTSGCYLEERTGNLQELITGTFETLSIRSY